MRWMVAVWFLALAYGQNETAEQMLARISKANAQVKTWRGELTLTVAVKQNGESAFTTYGAPMHVVEKLPGSLKLQSTTGIVPFLNVCDKETEWMYLPRPKLFRKISFTAGKRPCNPSFYQWSHLTENLKSATFTGKQTLAFNDKPVTCDEIQATAESAAPDGPTKTTLWKFCVEPNENLLIQSEEEERVLMPPPGSKLLPVRAKQTYTWSKVERDVPVDESEFHFEPPPDTRPSDTVSMSIGPILIGQLAFGQTAPPGVFRIGGGVTAPTLTFKVEPKYAEEARQAKIEGTVLLRVIIGADGVPGDIQVLRGLGYGLDEEAIAAVTNWRFKPGVRNGEPVRVQATIEVNFRLLPNPPPQ